MCGVSMRNRPESPRVPCEELRDRMGLDCTIVLQSSLRWFGHKERMNDDSSVMSVRSLNIGSAAARGRPKKTLVKVVQ